MVIAATVPLYSQEAHDMLVGVHADLVKTDQTRLFRKGQFGGEFNYYATSSITATAGFEVWTPDRFSFLIGMRWYPNDYTLIRVRGLIGANDISLGAGWTKPILENMRFEAIADFYFKIDFALRAGIVYRISKN